MDDRCPTGISGFDDLIEGGIPRNRTILVNGSCGTGKTVFVTQFLHNGITKHGEPGILVMLEQDAKEFKEDMLKFNFDLQKLEDDGKLIIINANLTKKEVSWMKLESEHFDIDPSRAYLDNISDLIESAASQINAKRVAIDSLSSMAINLEDQSKLRHTILEMNYRLKTMNLTTLMISDELSGDMMVAAEKYVVDGVITLRYVTIGPDPGRTLVIDKMRRTQHSENIHTLKFVPKKGLMITNE